MEHFGMIIGGKKQLSASTFSVINPATEEVIAECPQAQPADVDLAVSTAKSAFDSWSQLPDSQRQSTIHKLGQLIESNLEQLMQLVTLETGKPLKGLNEVGSGMEVAGAAAWAHATAEMTLPVEVIQDDAETLVELHHKPIGVVGSITPWNWPLILGIWHIMPALRAGNTVVMKPSEYTPLATLKFAELANSILPPGVLNVITGYGEVGAAMANHPGIDKIVFTGSSPTGRKIMSAASTNLKRLTLELGGNDAAIVLPDVDLEKVVPLIFGASFHNNGQTCAAIKRIYVHHDIHRNVCEALGELANKVVVGDGMESETELGPLQNRKQLDIVSSLVEDARNSGATFLSGETPHKGRGYFHPPTVLTNLPDDARIIHQEQFGPVIPVVPFNDVTHAIELANNSPDGLGGSVWSNDLDQAYSLATTLQCGSSWINEHATIRPDIPFGGIKQSGFGVENGEYGIKEFTYLQVVKMNRL